MLFASYYCVCLFSFLINKEKWSWLSLLKPSPSVHGGHYGEASHRTRIAVAPPLATNHRVNPSLAPLPSCMPQIVLPKPSRDASTWTHIQWCNWRLEAMRQWTNEHYSISFSLPWFPLSFRGSCKAWPKTPLSLERREGKKGESRGHQIFFFKCTNAPKVVYLILLQGKIWSMLYICNNRATIISMIRNMNYGTVFPSFQSGL